MKMWVVSVWLMFLFVIIGALFWYNELVYQLPTPVPKDYKPVYQGQLIRLSGPSIYDSNQPVFFHFFNPDCPCSRFNMANFKSLVKQYGGKIHFVVVVINNYPYTVKQIQDKFDLNIPVTFDQSIAKACGVYSTPQVALLNVRHELYYRGNYNRSRYCADEKTNYAKMAIEGLLNAHPKIAFTQLALTAYGCQLTACNK